MKTFKFYGVCENTYKLDDKVWEAIEDPSDGYRSYLKSIECVSNYDNFKFFSDPIAEVKVSVSSTDALDGWKLVDVKDGHVWLEVGTCNADDYYPSFVFRYTPHPPVPSWLDFIQED